MITKFTENAQKVLQIAEDEAIRMKHGSIGAEHILLGLIQKGKSLEILMDLGIPLSSIVEEVKKISKKGEEDVNEVSISYNLQARKVVEFSLEEAHKLEQENIGTEHLLLGIIRGDVNKAAKVLNSIGVSFNKIRQQVLKSVNDNSSSSKRNTSTKKMSTPTVDEITRDLTEVARNNGLDPVIGRDREVTRMIEILSRRNKNNPVLIGEPGVGKTAIAEGLAQRIISKDVPESLIDKRVVIMDMGVVVAGTKYRGEFENRMKNLMKEVEEAGDIIMFIDELHTLIGAGSTEGSLDASNILKPALSRGTFQCIGATTLDEYRKYIEKDTALERRFQPIQVDEPSVDETTLILKGLRPKYEDHHRLEITDEAIEAASAMSSRYISDRFLPDKAIDLIDEAGSKVRLRSYTKSDSIKSLGDKLEAVKAGKALAIMHKDFERASNYREDELSLEESLNELNRVHKEELKLDSPQVTESDIADVVAMWTGIPVSKITETESSKLLNMEKILHESVIGQREAVSAVSKAVRRARAGIKNSDKPVGSFIFMGSSGIGKSQLAKTLAETMFGDEEAMIRIDMTEYMEKHSTSRLVGSPPGYVGHEEGGQLTELVRRKPYSVILLDEIEKAHPDVFNMLLQVLDDGRLTDSKGRTVDFRNTIVIMTSNVGAQTVKETKYVGFGTQSTSNKSESEKSTMMEELRKAFRPEFLNRVDEIIVFHTLERNHLSKIVTLMLNDLTNRLKKMNVEFELTDAAKNKIIDIGYDPQYGARPLRRAIQKHIEDRLSEELLKGTFENDSKVVVGIKSGDFDVRVDLIKDDVLEVSR